MGLPRILLADDHPTVLEYVAALLAADFEVVGTAGDGQSAVELAERLRPEAAILDISMPRLSGLEASARMAKLENPPRVVFLTIHEDNEFRLAAREAGGSAYVLKPRLCTELIPAIRDALAGRGPLPSKSADCDDSRRDCVQT